MPTYKTSSSTSLGLLETTRCTGSQPDSARSTAAHSSVLPGNGAGQAVYKSSSTAKMAANLGSTTPDPLTQRAVLEQLFERRLVEGEYWYVVVAEWLEQLKKYLGIPSTRKFFHQRVHPGPIITRRDYAHTVEVLHEDAWKLLVQWYGFAEGHKSIKLVVYNYSRAPEIEHNPNNFKLMMTTSPLEDFHNVKFSKMEKVGHIEWKIRSLYDIPLSQNSRLWAKPDTDGEWRPLLVRDKAIGKVLDIDSDFTRPFVALEVLSASGKWEKQPDEVKATQDCPIGILYDHDIFEDITSTWEMDIHDQIDHVGRDFLERLHINFNSFVQRAKEYVDEKDRLLREKQRKLDSKDCHLDEVRDSLTEKEQRLSGEIDAYETRRQMYERKEEELEQTYEKKRHDLEKTMQERKQELDTDIENFRKAKANFDTELQRMSEMYKLQENRIKLDIGGQQFTTSLLTLTKDPDSMLAAMFSGRHRLKVETDGSYFIDRDGAHFRYILNYLRDGCIKEGTMPSNETMWQELLNEAEYYQLTGLVEYLRTLLVSRNMSRSSSSGDVVDIS